MNSNRFKGAYSMVLKPSVHNKLDTCTPKARIDSFYNVKYGKQISIKHLIKFLVKILIGYSVWFLSGN